MKKTASIFFLAIWTFSLNAGNYGIGEKAQYRIDTLMNRALSDSVFCGSVVAVVRENKIVYQNTWGFQSVVPERRAMRSDAIFDIASLTKSIATTTVAMKLAEEGLIDLDAPVKKYIPGFAPYSNKRRKCTSDTTDILVKHLMYHSSGLPAYAYPTKLCQYGTGEHALLEYIIKDAKRSWKPGTRFRYSCLNYITLQHIIESVSGRRLCDLAEELVFRPLGMADTRYYPDGAPEEILERIVPTETVQDSTGAWNCICGTVHDPLARDYMHGNSGNAGVFSTAGDLCRFSSMLLCGGVYDGERILKQSTVKTIRRKDPATGRALGWDCDSRGLELPGTIWDRRYVICHTGFTGTSIVLDFKSKTAVILLCSRLHRDNAYSKKPGRMLMVDIRRELSDIVAADTMK